MKKCPNCNSKKYEGNCFQKRCQSCGFSSTNPLYHKVDDMSISRLEVDKPHSTPRTTEQFVKDDSDINLLEIDYHNVAYKIPITKDKPDVHLAKSIPMKNWIQEVEETDSVTIQRNPKSVVIFLNRRIKKSICQADTTIAEALKEVLSEAEGFTKRTGIELGKPEPMRKEVKIVKPFVPAGTLFVGDIAKSVYPTGQVEFTDKDKAMEHAKNFVENQALESNIPKLFDIMAKWNENFELHYSVLKDISANSKEQAKQIERLTDMITKQNQGNLHRVSIYTRIRSFILGEIKNKEVNVDEQ